MLRITIYERPQEMSFMLPAPTGSFVSPVGIGRCRLGECVMTVARGLIVKAHM
jgi:hypothetical protein